MNVKVEGIYAPLVPIAVTVEVIRSGKKLLQFALAVDNTEGQLVIEFDRST